MKKPKPVVEVVDIRADSGPNHTLRVKRRYEVCISEHGFAKTGDSVAVARYSSKAEAEQHAEILRVLVSPTWESIQRTMSLSNKLTLEAAELIEAAKVVK
jgi:hypothetical protein